MSHKHLLALQAIVSDQRRSEREKTFGSRCYKKWIGPKKSSVDMLVKLGQNPMTAFEQTYPLTQIYFLFDFLA